MVDGYILLGRQHLRNDYDDNIIMEKVFHSIQEAIKASYQIYVEVRHALVSEMTREYDDIDTPYKRNHFNKETGEFYIEDIDGYYTGMTIKKVSIDLDSIQEERLNHNYGSEAYIIYGFRRLKPNENTIEHYISDIVYPNLQTAINESHKLYEEKLELIKDDCIINNVSIIANCFDNETGRFLVSNMDGHYIEGDIKKVHIFPSNKDNLSCLDEDEALDNIYSLNQY